jgi:transcriptional regulator with XRE-family HTH domain
MTSVRILLAKNIKNYREILGISQMKLAEEAGCSTTLIGKIETMKRFPSADTIDSIAKALKIVPAALFTDDGKAETVKSRVAEQKRKSQLKMKILKAIDEAF